jgi:hypothetical protein
MVKELLAVRRDENDGWEASTSFAALINVDVKVL